MVKVKLLVPRTGPAGAQNAGDEIEVPAADAQRMVDAGQCEIVRGNKPERTVKRAKPEKASK